MTDRNHPAFKKEADPFYLVIMKGLQGEVDGEHFWDAVAEDAVFEFLYHFPGFANRIEGRQAYMDWFAGTVCGCFLPMALWSTDPPSRG